MNIIPKPEVGEYAPYTMMYIGLLPEDGHVLDHLRANLTHTRELASSLSESQLSHRYAEGKWTIKEILVHIADDERIYAYRALRFARNDRTELPGFEQDDFARYSQANDRTVACIMDEYSAVRAATVALFNNLSDEALVRRGTASGNVMSVRAAAYHIAGHELHHLQVIKQRYLSGYQPFAER